MSRKKTEVDRELDRLLDSFTELRDRAIGKEPAQKIDEAISLPSAKEERGFRMKLCMASPNKLRSL